jgi:uncharacterized repeat protein (TIGR01451 family)
MLSASGAIAWAVLRDGSDYAPSTGAPIQNMGTPGLASRFGQPAGAVMFQSVVPGDSWNQIGLVPVENPASPRSMIPMRCLRIHFEAGRGLCLAEGDGLPGTFAAYILNADLQQTGSVTLTGLPSRTRVSPDGRYGATTTFVTGHSYAEDGFSTETLLLDLDRAETIANLEDFTAFKDGEEIREEDFNYWGVTFTQDTNQFYATLATGGRTYLVRGDIEASQVEVLHENVECPSISPDNTRIAYKKKIGDGMSGTIWRFHVLDFSTMVETPLAETRSIDDQIMWLDDGNVLYGDGSDTWVMAADGSGQPRRFMSKAVSPVVVADRETMASPAANGEATAQLAGSDTLVLAETDIGVRIDMPGQVSVGEELTYTITATNNGPNEATWLSLDHYLPPELAFGSVSVVDQTGIPHSCSPYLDEHRIHCDTQSLSPGSSWTISMTVTPGASGAIGLRATVGAMENDPTPANDQVLTDLVVSP